MKISELNVNDRVNITLVVKSASARETRAKKPYLALELYDGTSIINGNYWDWVTGNIPPVNAILDVTATVTEWQGVKQLNIVKIATNTERHLSEFMPTGSHDIAQTYKDAYALASDIRNDALRTITLSILEELKDLWLTVPGAVSVHHNYVGGTLVHSLGVARMALSICNNIPEANKDLCVAGGLLHDIGKLFTYKINGVNIEYTDEGRIFEHIFMGAEFVGNFAESHIDADDDTNYSIVRLLKHIILSHHGKQEYGSPITPKCIEAYIVSAADGINAQAEQIRAACAKDGVKVWTDKVFGLGGHQQINPAAVKKLFDTADLPI